MNKPTIKQLLGRITALEEKIRQLEAARKSEVHYHYHYSHAPQYPTPFVSPTITTTSFVSN